MIFNIYFNSDNFKFDLVESINKIKSKYIKQNEIACDLQYYRNMQNVCQESIRFIEKLSDNVDEKELVQYFNFLKTALIEYVPNHTGNISFERSIKLIETIASCTLPIVSKLRVVK